MRSIKKKSASKNAAYIERINRVLDHIHSNLAQSIRLDELARIAELSPFHFHRVFQAMVGQTPHDTIKRLRLERSLYLMSHGKPKSLTAVAIDSGFSSLSDFTRSFKSHYGVAPSRFDLAAWQAQHDDRIKSAIVDSPFKVEQLGSRANPDRFRVRIRELPSRKVAYIRVSNPYAGKGVIEATHRLMTWAQARHLADGQWLGYQYESPQFTSLEACHYCVAVEVEEEFEPQGEIGQYLFPEMLVAEVEMKGDIELEIRLLHWLYGSWLPRSRYIPDDQPSFEAWIGKPFAHGHQHFELKVQLPIK